jgi:hypothetical protein
MYPIHSNGPSAASSRQLAGWNVHCQAGRNRFAPAMKTPAPQGARMGRGLYHASRRNPGPHAHAHAHTAAETALGSARVPRASSGVAPELPSHQRPGNFRRGKVCGTRFSARRRKPHARSVCSRSLRRTGCGFSQIHIPPRARRKMFLTMRKAGNIVGTMKKFVPHRAAEEQC